VHNEVLKGLTEDALDHHSNHSGNGGGGRVGVGGDRGGGGGRGGADALASDLEMSDLEGDELDGSNQDGSNTGERGDFFGVVGPGGYRSLRHPTPDVMVAALGDLLRDQTRDALLGDSA
jgi:hypothetical protein